MDSPSESFLNITDKQCSLFQPSTRHLQQLQTSSEEGESGELSAENICEFVRESRFIRNAAEQNSPLSKDGENPCFITQQSIHKSPFLIVQLRMFLSVSLLSLIALGLQ